MALVRSAFSYLTSHGALDIEHLTFFETLMNQVDDPADQAAIIEVAKAIFQRFAAVFRSIPHVRETAHA